MGSSNKSYTTCRAQQRAGYNPLSDISTDLPPHMCPSAIDLKRALNQDWDYLIPPRAPGELHVGVLGKTLGLAAGKVYLHYTL
jgi:hypothetical protein